MTGTFWTFDDKGQIDVGLRRSTGEWLDFAWSVNARENTRGGRVVDLVPELRRKELHAKHRWTVSQDDLDRIAADLWPGIHGEAPALEAIKGKVRRRPPMTGEGKEALREIGIHALSIDHQLSTLSEPALKGLEFEAERHGTFEDQALWRGIAAHAKARRAILAAHRTGRGDWYAVIEAFWRESPISDRSVAEAYVKGKNRVEAVMEGRKLIAAKAEWLDTDVRLHVTLYSALEWKPEDES